MGANWVALTGASSVVVMVDSKGALSASSRVGRSVDC